MIALAPASTALDTATVIPRSLNEPVGLAPSTFRYTSQPVREDSVGAGSSGVPPSCRVITGVAEVTGSRSRNSLIKPRHIIVNPSISRRRSGGRPDVHNPPGVPESENAAMAHSPTPTGRFCRTGHRWAAGPSKGTIGTAG